MCLSHYVQSRHWNWGGDEIVHDPVVPSHRPVPGRSQRRSDASYPIDPREFLVTDDNAVVGLALRNEVVPSAGEPTRMHSRAVGDFDYRADVVTRWVGEHVVATADGRDTWLFPDEVLHVRRGDCEDRACLLASLLVAAGISSYNVRVAIGRMVFRRGAEVVVAHDHAWVVYRREDGQWQILEPLPPVKAPRRATRSTQRVAPRRYEGTKISYEPEFVWNRDHLWRVFGGDNKYRTFAEAALRSEWNRLDPAFSGDVHRSLLHDALGGYGSEIVTRLQASFTYMFGSYIDWPDMPNRYDPRDHFDNCTIADSWARVGSRLGVFARTRELRVFGLAAHAIGDFYAHSSYSFFAVRETVDGHERVRPFDPAWLAPGALNAQLASPARYDAGGFDLHRSGFTRGPRWKGDATAAAAEWAGQILSGRYAQEGDSKSLFERFTWIPDAVENAPGFNRCAAAPHHEEIAVDSGKGSNVLYGKNDFATEFGRRYAGAVHHVRAEFAKVWGPAPGAHPF